MARRATSLLLSSPSSPFSSSLLKGARHFSSLRPSPSSLSSSSSSSPFLAHRHPLTLSPSSSTPAHFSSLKPALHTGRKKSTLVYVCIGGALTLAAYYSNSVKDAECESSWKLPFTTSSTSTPSTGNKFKFQHAATMFPHPEKEYKGGEDAYFVSDNGKTMGVADGVGGWASKGVDPAIYARALMEGAKGFANSHPEVTDPVAIMEAGYTLAIQHLGSSTCCIVLLDGSHLNSANLGDSGFMVIRGEHVLYRTKEQQHRFNFPFQLGKTSKDKPEHSNVDRIPVQSGDIVIVGTDGLFDNLYDHQILSCVVKNRNTQPQQLSNAVAKLARENAERKNGSSPFSDGSTQYGRPRQGGKMDDITVVVGVVA